MISPRIFMASRHLRASSRQRGVGLLEVLVAIVVLALGLLGLAALQITSLKGGHGAYLRSQAAQLTYDMGDRIRANPIAVDDYVMALGDPPECDPLLESDAATLAERDRAEWLNMLACLLPAGNGRVEEVVGFTNAYEITVFWSDREADEESGTNAEFALRVQL